MRARILTTGLIVVMGLGVLGCKSTPKLPWWKKSDVGAAAAVAHTAPALPSEVAKQAEGLTANPVQVATSSGSLAKTPAPSQTTPSTIAGSYPDTGAPSYLAPATASATASSTKSAALPYDPTSVPAPKTTAASLAASAPASVSAPAGSNRYADSYTEPAPAFSAPSMTTAVTSNAASAPVASTGTDSVLGSRYASVDVSSYLASASSAPNTVTAPQPTTVAAAASAAYRPGGTSTYPGSTASSATYEIASRPAENSESTAGSQSSGSYPVQNGTLQYR